jgi:hypothetical protein
MWTTVLC